MTSHPAFGRYASQVLSLLREVSADKDEKIFFAVPCGRFSTKGGYLLCTSQYLRWIQTEPGRADLFWSLDEAISEVGWTFFWLKEGTQFEMPKKAITEKFTMEDFGEIYRNVQQAINWEESHSRPSTLVDSSSTGNGGEMVGPLSSLAELFSRGLLTEKEFTDAKTRLLN